MKSYRIATLALAGTVALSCTQPAFAAESITPKQEVIYADLKADGSVQKIYAVNICTPKHGKITDRGFYDSVRNMNTNDPIQYKNGKIHINSKEEQVYYEGILPNTTPLPWNVDISYNLDGKEVAPETLAGNDGHLELSIQLSPEENCDSAFFKNFALQVTLMLDGDEATNILAPAATIANVGGDRQITFTVLPNQPQELTVSCDIHDFEMDAISLNGLPLNLQVEVDDDDLLKEVTKLQDGIVQLDDGAQELFSGSSDLADGARELSEGTDTLKKGVENNLSEGADQLHKGAFQLDDGILALNQGLQQAYAGLEQLNENSDSLTEGSQAFLSALLEVKSALAGVSASAEDVEQLVSASGQIKTGISSLADGAGALSEQLGYDTYYKLMLDQGLDLKALDQGNTQASQTIETLLDKVSHIVSKAEKLGIPSETYEGLVNDVTALANTTLQLLAGSSANIQGIQKYLSQLDTAADQLHQGASALESQYIQFDSAVNQLAVKLGNLLGQMNQLAGAVNALADAYSDLDSGLNTYTDGVAAVLAGYQAINQGASQLAEGSSQLKAGTSSMQDGVNTVLDGVTTLNDGSKELSSGTDQLCTGTNELKDGTGTLRHKTSGLDTEVTDRIDEMIADMTGKLNEIPSFVTQGDMSVDGVQFVLKTEPIHKETIELEPEAEPAPSSFKDKLLGLFRK